jgi:hypothetical protein
VKKLSTLALIAALGAWTSASATIIQGTSLADQLYAAGARNLNVHTDQVLDEKWQVTATGFAGARLLFELAGFSNSNAFGVYDLTNTSNRLTIFSGPNGAGSRGLLANDGNQFCAGLWLGAMDCADFGSHMFGFFLQTPETTFYSQEHLNADNEDHMVGFEGGEDRGMIANRPWVENEFILAWEDLFGGGDRDFDDFGVLVGPIVAIAEPASLALFGIGLIGVLYYTRRRRVGIQWAKN